MRNTSPLVFKIRKGALCYEYIVCIGFKSKGEALLALVNQYPDSEEIEYSHSYDGILTASKEEVRS